MSAFLEKDGNTVAGKKGLVDLTSQIPFLGAALLVKTVGQALEKICNPIQRLPFSASF